MKPIRISPSQRSNLWHAKGNVWARHNDDEVLGRDTEALKVRRMQEQAEKNVSTIYNPNNKYKRTQKEILDSINDN